eukprot:CAMPEP_0206053908 /NCGR_PEP_ID=MMETSP1466-20131121/36843_1 /ASSEMBLY_ACC=CAM_ASM_001126 /TAXON_ID=44452 /ORGANISM="Pavlova gyrans, Strain CCMP608" /LENGTH=417 /DNA_ID=CAMNT_0053429095 /DNA_START=44 /DNA_END=1295 /DNA_ORIENTATION=-
MSIIARATFRAAASRSALRVAPALCRRLSTVYTTDHEYVTNNGGVATVGITKFAAEALGDIVFVELPEVGATIEQKETMGVVESVKAASDVYMPVSGEVVEVNEALKDEPGLVNKSPIGDGWMAKIKLSNPGELDEMMDEKAYAKFCEEAHEALWLAAEAVAWALSLRSALRRALRRRHDGACGHPAETAAGSKAAPRRGFWPLACTSIDARRPLMLTPLPTSPLKIPRLAADRLAALLLQGYSNARCEQSPQPHETLSRAASRASVYQRRRAGVAAGRWDAACRVTDAGRANRGGHCLCLAVALPVTQRRLKSGVRLHQVCDCEAARELPGLLLLEPSGGRVRRPVAVRPTGVAAAHVVIHGFGIAHVRTDLTGRRTDPAVPAPQGRPVVARPGRPAGSSGELVLIRAENPILWPV